MLNMCIHTTLPLLAAPVEALDFFIPTSVRYHDITSSVNHKQLWSTWKGLSSAHAEELAIYELAFRHVIQEKIAAYIDGFLGSSVTQESIFTIKVNLVELAMEIADSYYSTCLSPSTLLNLSNVVQFVRLHDCFIRPTSTSNRKEARIARFRVRTSQESITPVIVAYSPKLVFDDLVVQAPQGQNYYLKPRYTPAFTASKHSEYHPRVTYTTTCEWLRYHEEKNHFAGTVPQSSRATQIIEVKATIVYRFPDTGVSHEEVIRATVKILPIAPGVEFDHPASTPFIKQVRFASDPPARKASEDRLLPSHNPFSVLQNCSNMDRDGQFITYSSSSDDVADISFPSVPELDEVTSCSSRLAVGTYSGPKSIHAGLLSVYKATDVVAGPSSRSASGTCSVPESIHAGLQSFYEVNGKDTELPTDTLSPTELEDDGISAQICENVRELSKVEFAPEEDPRDVRVMKKDLLQMQLQDLSKSMLGFRIDRWSSEDTSTLSDVQEMSEDSELESSLRESIGY